MVGSVLKTPDNLLDQRLLGFGVVIKEPLLGQNMEINQGALIHRVMCQNLHEPLELLVVDSQ